MPRPAPWTAEQAREMARRSHLPTSARFRKHPQPSQDQPQLAHDADYQDRRLARVRVQLNQLDEAITRETSKVQPDGQRLNWLAQAQDRLSEQERILAGRPLPGSRRPREERSRPTPAYDDSPPVPAKPVAPVAPAPVVPPPSFPEGGCP